MKKQKTRRLTRKELERKIKTLEGRIGQAYYCAGDAMASNGDDVYRAVDQLVRTLAGRRYKQVVKEQMAGDEGPETYAWFGIKMP